MNIPLARQSSDDELDYVVLQYFPERSTELLNPSVKFNEYILSKVPESDVIVTHDSIWMLPMLVADVIRSGLSIPRLLTAVSRESPSYFRSTRRRTKRARYFKVRLRKPTFNPQEFKTSALFPSLEYAWIFSCLFVPIAPTVDTEVHNYIDRFPMFNTSELVLEFAKGASYIFRQIPFSEELLQNTFTGETRNAQLRVKGARSSQSPRRPQSVHQVGSIFFRFSVHYIDFRIIL
ncbi:uncharacterized protein EV420DRAFT_1572446 [Desarmillaria tabescens]|uniref:Uncharacterized protein n=1 Tax=Armillaria tabescens TaxID=1929756 RepID=A0AA39MT64_ARMTA|nr:uncharacterized protein EV420DRAFT_1572446 [Desarmillaria tabescens]KAK0445323.1 hypothetical protein EV420DRAFT_1572446 [Desarmillaria tabescens]